MQFEKVKKQIQCVVFNDIRSDEPGYFEAVILKDKLQALTENLEISFGKAAFPSDSGLSVPMEQAVSEFGGIREGQTLYFWGTDHDCIFAMLWPWQDQQHITLKLARR